MKNLIIATAIALTSLVAFNAPSQAAPLTGTLAQTVDTQTQVVKVDHRRGWRHHRHWNRRCFVRTERHRHHGRVIIRRVRVCR
ncbi:hypothetical protein HB779_10720 [Phyllobacterium sp. 628]|uniref:hypothetical protein n=1 Tax=Phyllobacterium sp. 628 TaxID=2718938 RepID=UPI00166285CE|nr:hypothetical protein [Phyllobacterium sp. 628]QND52332.1 hypothetical protein HB779_10720 [Phyllobacterium sp. 628]